MKNSKFIFATVVVILLLSNLYLIIENQKLNRRIAILESQIKSFQSEKSFQDKNENYPVLEEEDIEYQELVDSVTKDWNIYRNEVYGFEIKYPEKNKGTFEKFDEPIVKNELASFWWSFEQKNRADFAIYILKIQNH